MAKTTLLASYAILSNYFEKHYSSMINTFTISYPSQHLRWYVMTTGKASFFQLYLDREIRSKSRRG